MVIVWVLVAVVLLAVEAFTTAFFAVFIAAGLVGGAIVAAAGGGIALQLAVIGVISAVGVLLARRPLVHLMTRNRPIVSLPGISSLVGQGAMTLDQVGDEHHPGHARLGGERWLAVSESGAPLAPDTSVVVAAVRGTTLIVRPSGDEHPAPASVG